MALFNPPHAVIGDGVLELDLSSLESVRAAAARVRTMLETGEIDSLQAILSNAGAQFQGPVSYSADGYEGDGSS